MLRTDPASINVDCWLAVIDQLHGDFRTLSRLMQVSQQFLVLAALCLYGQLSDETALQQMTYWSDKKRNGLAALLWVSSGCKFTHWQMKHEERYGKQDRKEQEVWVPWTQYSASEDCVRFKFPLFINYFSLLKRLPKELIGERIWSDFMKPIGLNENKSAIVPKHSEEFNIRLAKLVAEIRMDTVREVKYWLTMVNYLSKLLILRLPDFHEISCEAFLEEFNSILVKFVKAHMARFPETRLTLIEGRWKGPLDYKHFRELNEIVGPEMIKVQRLERIGSMMARDKWWTLTRNLNQFEFDMTYNNPWSDYTIPYLPENDLKVMDHVAKFLEKCRKLKRLHLLDLMSSNRTWTNVFTWAKNERALLERDQRMVLNIGAEHQRQQQQQLSPSPQFPLIQLEDFTCQFIPMVVVMDVVDLFRNSLERLSINQDDMFDSALTWSWPLTRLTSLQLEGCRFHFGKLEYCTVLQNLSLERVYGGGEEFSGVLHWRISISMRKSLRSLKLADGEAANFLDLDSLGDAKELESLHLSYRGDMLSRRNIEHNPAWHQWNLTNLKKLTLNTANNVLFWQGILLKAAPNLEMYSTVDSWMDLPKDFMEEQVKDQKRSTIISSSSKSHDDGNDTVGLKNIFTTKIRYIEFADFYILDRLQHLGDCLGRSKPLSMEDLPTLTTLPTTNHTLCELGFPFLTHIVFRSESKFRKLEGVVELTGIFEDLILELLKRPIMKWIRTHTWEPRKSFVELALTKVEIHHVPLKSRGFIDNAAESGDEFTKSCCLLEVNSSWIHTHFYQLKK